LCYWAWISAANSTICERIDLGQRDSIRAAW
jgi:hypothetical protein